MKIQIVKLAAVAMAAMMAAGAAGAEEIGIPDGTFFKGDRWYVYVLATGHAKTLPAPGSGRAFRTLVAGIEDGELEKGRKGTLHAPGSWTLASGTYLGSPAFTLQPRTQAVSHLVEVGAGRDLRLGGKQIRCFQDATVGGGESFGVFAIQGASLPELRDLIALGATDSEFVAESAPVEAEAPLAAAVTFLGMD